MDMLPNGEREYHELTRIYRAFDRSLGNGVVDVNVFHNRSDCATVSEIAASRGRGGDGAYLLRPRKIVDKEDSRRRELAFRSASAFALKTKASDDDRYDGLGDLQCTLLLIDGDSGGEPLVPTKALVMAVAIAGGLNLCYLMYLTVGIVHDYFM